MSKEAYNSGRVRQAVQDGSREFITLLACVSAIGKALPPALIYKGESYDLQDTWVDEVGEQDNANFAASSNGWSNDAFGLKWLEQIFHRYTRRIAGNRRRLLIVDGHSSHLNMAFLNKCDELRILVLILPPHSTHRLQPLDLVLFLALSTAYSKQINSLLVKGLGLVSLTKRLFWPLFRVAWDEAFSEANILSAFQKAGTWPFAPQDILTTITRPETPPETSINLPIRLKTPVTVKSMRQHKSAYLKDPSRDKVDLLFKANERLATQHVIDEITKKGLIEALQIETKKRTRGKRLNLVGEECSGPQFFSPSRIQAARVYQAEKAAEQQAEKAAKVAVKALNKERKVREEAAKAEARLQRQVVKNMRAQIEAEKRTAKELQKQDKSTIIVQNSGPKQKPIKVPKAKKASIGQKRSVQFANILVQRGVTALVYHMI
jgi:hypothetical protein